MVHPLSAFGIIHTLLSLIPVFVGAWALWTYGRIVPENKSGRWYLTGMLLSIFTSFGLTSTGGFNEAHALGVVALGALAVGYNSQVLNGLLGRATPYVEIASLSFSYALLFIPAINETLKRIPPADPISNGPDTPIVLALVGLVLLLFVIGTTWQLLRLRARQRMAAPA